MSRSIGVRHSAIEKVACIAHSTASVAGFLVVRAASGAVRGDDGGGEDDDMENPAPHERCGGRKVDGIVLQGEGGLGLSPWDSSGS